MAYFCYSGRSYSGSLYIKLNLLGLAVLAAICHRVDAKTNNLVATRLTYWKDNNIKKLTEMWAFYV